MTTTPMIDDDLATGPFIAPLAERGVVRASGPNTIKLLDGILTNDLERLARQPVIHAGLLSPQGKILFAVFLAADGDGVLIDVRRAAVTDLVKRLELYRLRAKVAFEDVSERIMVAALWGGEPELPAGVLGGADPRATGLGQRLFLPPQRQVEIAARVVDATAYDDRRIAAGVADEERDYAVGDTFPHEANFDLTGCVDFSKGCFVGQEVVSRMQHKTVVRKRVVGITVPTGAARLRAGADLSVTGVPATVGRVGSVSRDGLAGLAFVKLDRIAEALA